MKCDCRQFVSAGHLPACDEWAKDIDDEHRTPEEVYIAKLETALCELAEKSEVLCDVMQKTGPMGVCIICPLERRATMEALTKANDVLREKEGA